MFEPPLLDLKIVFGAELDKEVRGCLRPGEVVPDRHGGKRRLPSTFYEIPSWEAAMETRLTPNFGIWEVIDVDVREAAPVRTFPRYIPCAVVVLAMYLQSFRDELGRVVRIAANGGYRSPAHAYSHHASTHSWGSAANIYRIGDDLLDSSARIRRYAQLASSMLPGARIRRYGRQPGYAFDHLHIDLGYLTLDPHAGEVDRPARNR